MPIFWFLVACVAEAPVDGVVEPRVDAVPVEVVEATTPPTAPSVQPEVSTPQPTHGEGVPPVVLVWTGIGALHKGFFSDTTLTRNLGSELSSLVRPPANVHIQFDSAKHLGRIRLRLLPETLAVPIPGEGDGVKLSTIAPILVALARYRSGVASRYDIRVESFHIGLESFRGATHCLFSAGGTSPPDGRIVSPCVAINGQKACGSEANGAVVFSSDAARSVRTCLN